MVAVVAVSRVVVVAAVAGPVARPEGAAPRVVTEEVAGVEALGHQVRGPLEMMYSEGPHLLISVSHPPT